MVEWMICYNIWKWSSVQNKQHGSQHWDLWSTTHKRRRRGSKIVDNHTLISVQKVWSKPLESGRERMPKTVSRRRIIILLSIVSNAAERSSKSWSEILSSSIAFSKSFQRVGVRSRCCVWCGWLIGKDFRGGVRSRCCVWCGWLIGKDCRGCFLGGI